MRRIVLLCVVVVVLSYCLASDELNEAVGQVEANHGNKLEQVLGLNREERDILSAVRQKPSGHRAKRGTDKQDFLAIHGSLLETRQKRAGTIRPRPKIAQ